MKMKWLLMLSSVALALAAESGVTREFHEAYVNALANFSGFGVSKTPSATEKAQTSLDQLDAAVAGLTSSKSAVDNVWGHASEAQKGNIAGATAAAERYILATAAGMDAQLGCSTPANPAAVPNYYAESSDLSVLDKHLTDTAEYLTATKACIPQDQKQSTTSKILHSQAVGIASGLHTEFWGKGKRDRAKMQDQMLAQMTGAVLSTSNALSQYLPPGVSPSESAAADSAAAVPASPAPTAQPVTGVAGDFPAGEGLPVLHTDRTPDEGCHWEPYVNREVGIALLVEQCTGKDASRSTDTNELVTTFGSAKNSEISVFTKAANQAIQLAIRQQAGTKVSAAARAACHALPDKSVGGGSKWQWYTFTATTGPLAKKETPSQIEDLPCSPWQDMDSASDFVYDPTMSKTKFLFVILGQETPSWDVESIQFLGGH